MLMKEPTIEKMNEWRKIWKEYKDKIVPDRKTGEQVVNYLKTNYTVEQTELVNGERPEEIIVPEIKGDDYISWKLPVGKSPEPLAFHIKNEGNGKKLYENQEDIFKGLEIYVIVDLVTGCFHCEGTSQLYDELVAFQGLDEMDMTNSFLVAQYVECCKKFGKIIRR